MARYEHPDIMDGGLTRLRTDCDKIAIVGSYSFGDSYATVNAAILAEAAMVDADLVLSTSGNNRVLTTAPKSDPSANASGGGAGNHAVLLDTTTSKVLYVTPATPQAIVAGNPVAIGPFVVTRTQPTV